MHLDVCAHKRHACLNLGWFKRIESSSFRGLIYSIGHDSAEWHDGHTSTWLARLKRISAVLLLSFVTDERSAGIMDTVLFDFQFDDLLRSGQDYGLVELSKSSLYSLLRTT
jgi:hypothetical protein